MNWTSKATLAVSVIAGAFALAGIVTPLTNQSTFCGGCHTIAPSYESWAKSSHKDVPCVACHVRPGLEGWWYDKVLAGTRDAVIYFAGTPTEASNLKAAVDSDTCLNCHRHILRVSEVAPRDLPAPVKEVGLVMGHHQHMDAFKVRGQGEGCTTCHAGVVHDEPIKGYPIVIPRGHVTADTKPWLPAYPEGSHLYTRALTDCFHCHDGKTQHQGKSLDRKCEICHLPEKISGTLLFN